MPIVNSGNYYYGFVEAGGRKYSFTLTLTEKPSDGDGTPKGSTGIFEVEWRLYKELGDSLNKFIDDRKEFTDPKDFYVQFSDFVKKNVKPYKTKTWYKNALKMGVLAKNLAQEMDYTQKYITDFDFDTRIMNIQITDSQFRVHKAVLELSLNYKNDPIKVISHELPLQKTEMYSGSQLDNIFSVTEFCEKFSELINCFQQFWNTIALVDSECWILDPPNPTFKDVSRRIKLSDTISVIVTFNPFCPCQRPKIKLLGCQSEVNQYENILQKNLENDIWDNEENLLFNLSNVLEISIPNKIFPEDPDAMDTDDGGECAICFMKDLDNAVPNEMCENSNCKSLYHSTCLFTYLISVPRNRDFFGKIQGECPNCDDVISCTVPKGHY